MVCEVCGRCQHAPDACGCVVMTPGRRSFLRLRTVAYLLLVFAALPLIEYSALAWLLLLLNLAGLVCSVANYQADPVALAETRRGDGGLVNWLFLLDPFMWMLVAMSLGGC
ncbi:MAG: hypothetical protein AB7S38_42210 [Vulcanimicrobiota bacterium]